jgi:hypothetical protein
MASDDDDVIDTASEHSAGDRQLLTASNGSGPSVVDDATKAVAETICHSNLRSIDVPDTAGKRSAVLVDSYGMALHGCLPVWNYCI